MLLNLLLNNLSCYFQECPYYWVIRENKDNEKRDVNFICSDTITS